MHDPDQHAAYKRHIKELEERVSYLESFLDEVHTRLGLISEEARSTQNTSIFWQERIEEVLDNKYEWKPSHD